jgi:hypothetical protein
MVTGSALLRRPASGRFSLASLAWVMMYWVEGVDVAFSERREDDLHERSLGFACAAPRLDAFKHRVGRHAFSGVG